MAPANAAERANQGENGKKRASSLIQFHILRLSPLRVTSTTAYHWIGCHIPSLMANLSRTKSGEFEAKKRGLISQNLSALGFYAIKSPIP
jgi:hypothetical protein